MAEKRYINHTGIYYIYLFDKDHGIHVHLELNTAEIEHVDQ
jgi:hypothetical protein